MVSGILLKRLGILSIGPDLLLHIRIAAELFVKAYAAFTAK